MTNNSPLEFGSKTSILMIQGKQDKLSYSRIFVYIHSQLCIRLRVPEKCNTLHEVCIHTFMWLRYVNSQICYVGPSNHLYTINQCPITVDFSKYFLRSLRQ